MIPTSIDGTDITGATIDGTDVQQITIDGDTVFSAGDDLTPNEVSHYRFEQNVLDSFGDNDGSLSGASFNTTSEEGNFSLDVGTDADQHHAVIPDSNSLDLNNFTISCYAYFNGFASEVNGLVVKGPQNANNVNYELRASSDGLDVAFGDGSNFYAEKKSTTINTGEWVHCVGTYDGSSLVAYVNGSQSSGSSVSATPNTNSDNLLIGKELDNDNDRAHHGYIDDVKIYNTALTASQISNQL